MVIATTPNLSKPGWLASDASLARERKRRQHRRLAVYIRDGAWLKLLVDGANTQHKWKPLLRSLPNGQEKAEKILVGVNVLVTAMDMHAIVATCCPFGLTVASGTEASADKRQATALAEIRRLGHLDIVVMEAIRAANFEGDCVLRIVSTLDGPRIEIAPAGVYMPLGDPLPNRQPSVWEGRWIVERTIPGARDKAMYLRVERHRRLLNPATGMSEWAIETEAYEYGGGTTGAPCGTDTIVDLATLKRVPLSRIQREGEEPIEDIVLTGRVSPTLIRIFTSSYRDDIEPMLNSGDLGLLDAMVAAMTRVVRTAAVHGDPKMRVPPNMLKDGKIDLQKDVLDDPQKLFEVFVTAFDFAGMLDVMDSLINWMLVRTWMAPALLGVKLKGGAAPESYDKLRLEATQTLAIGKRAAVYMNAALSLAMQACSEIHARSTLTASGGYAVAPVIVELKPQLPKDEKQQREDLREQYDAGQMSHLTMLQSIWGIETGQREYDQIQAEKLAEVNRQRSALFDAVMPNAGGQL